jgi:hypothetical protein
MERWRNFRSSLPFDDGVSRWLRLYGRTPDSRESDATARGFDGNSGLGRRDGCDFL